MPIGARSMAATNARGRLGATPKDSTWRSSIEQVDGAKGARHDALDDLADRLEHR